MMKEPKYVVIDLTIQDSKVISSLMLMWVILSTSESFRECVKNSRNVVLIEAYNNAIKSMNDGSFINLNQKIIENYKAAIKGCE